MTSMPLASGRVYEFPEDPVVSDYLAQPRNYFPSIMQQFKDGTYNEVFSGKSGMVFLDLGANIGLVSLFGSDSCSRIVAVEPDPDTFQLLKRVLAPLGDKVMTMNVALAQYAGVCKFWQNDQNTTASSTVNTYGKQIQVQARTLMDILADARLSRVDFCKVDVEGAEGTALDFEALRHARPIIRSYHIEVHNCPQTTWEFKLSNICLDLTMLGYKVRTNGMSVFAVLK